MYESVTFTPDQYPTIWEVSVATQGEGSALQVPRYLVPMLPHYEILLHYIRTTDQHHWELLCSAQWGGAYGGGPEVPEFAPAPVGEMAEHCYHYLSSVVVA